MLKSNTQSSLFISLIRQVLESTGEPETCQTHIKTSDEKYTHIGTKHTFIFSCILITWVKLGCVCQR